MATMAGRVAAALIIAAAGAGSAAAQENCGGLLSSVCLKNLGAGAEALEADESCAAQLARYRACLADRARASGPGAAAPSPQQEASAQAAYEAVKDRGDPARLELVARRFPNTFWGELAAEDAASLRAAAASASLSPAGQSYETPPVARGADAEALIAKAEDERGAWVGEIDFSAGEPALFKHYFVMVEGSEWIARGAIVTGERWDHSESPLFRVVHGYLAKASDKSWHVSANRLAYLGPSWRPEFAEMSEQMFSQGGKALAEYVEGP